jgi:hypothetical protein
MNVKVKLLSIGEPTYGGVTYTKEMANAVVEQFNALKVKSNTILGEFGIPDPRSASPSRVSLQQSSHSIENMWIEDGDLFSEIEVLETQRGRILKSWMDSNDTEFVIRAVGSLDDDKVVTSVEFITVDADALPVLQSFFI